MALTWQALARSGLCGMLLCWRMGSLLPTSRLYARAGNGKALSHVQACTCMLLQAMSHTSCAVPYRPLGLAGIDTSCACCPKVLLAASAQLGPGDAYYRLWPLAAHLSNPWTLVVDRVLDLVSEAGEGDAGWELCCCLRACWCQPVESLLRSFQPDQQLL